jgi:hypothetical protein
MFHPIYSLGHNLKSTDDGCGRGEEEKLENFHHDEYAVVLDAKHPENSMILFISLHIGLVSKFS